MKEIVMPLPLIRYALLTSLICYLPYTAIVPWWLCFFIAIVLSYKLISAYYGLARPPKSILIVLIPSCLILLKLHYGTIISSTYYIGALLTFIGLKIAELYNERDVKVLIFCNFYLIFAVLISLQELWVILYLLVALFANLSLMLKLTAPQASLWQIGGKSIKQVLIALPLSMLLFYIVPRLATPLWQVPTQAQTHVGFSDKMTPGSIAQLFKDKSIAFRVTFKNKPTLNSYWHGLALNFYNGMSWSSIIYDNHFTSLPPLDSTTHSDYEVLLEPHQQKWLFYIDYPSASTPKLLLSPSYGLVNENRDSITLRFAYAIKSQTMPYHALTPNERLQNTQLPRTSNPQLTEWAKQHYAQLNQDPKAFINFLHTYIQQQPFWYTLSPPALPPVNQMDVFWFETKQGFCEHYASAVAFILRSVKIPARVVLGYQGGEWNPIADYLTLQQSDAHAWVEYWQEGLGWQQLDPTAFIAAERIDQAIVDQQQDRLNQNDASEGHLSWLLQSELLLESARFFTERWLLFYNQETQRSLLNSLGLAQWDSTQLARAAIGCVILFIIVIGLFYQWRQKRTTDPLLLQYQLLQRELIRFKVSISPPTTLRQQCLALINHAPNLAGIVTLFLAHYEQLRLQEDHPLSKENNKKTQKLFQQFRLKLKQERSRKKQM